MTDSLFSVAGQVVLVSGGSRGIGRAIAEGFARRGAKVIVTGRDAGNVEKAAKELSTAEQPVRGMVADVADSKAIQKLVTDALAAFGRIDCLVNVAGVNRRMPTEKLTEEDFDYILDINLKGSFLLAQGVGRHMLERRGGTQINVASLNNHAPLPWVLPYAASKAAVAQMTRSLASEWGDRGVRVNCIAPGFVLTDLTKKLWSHPTMQEWGLRNTPLRRLGKPEDMVGTAIFLASEASAFMTGQVLFVDGGFSSGMRWPIEEATQPT